MHGHSPPPTGAVWPGACGKPGFGTSAWTAQARIISLSRLVIIPRPSQASRWTVTQSTKVRFVISTEKIGRHVLLLIEEVSPAEEEPAEGVSTATDP